MNSLKRIITAITVIFTICSVSAQDLLTLVPNNASFVGMLNIGQIATKADFENLISLPFVQKIDEGIAKELSRDLIKADTSNYLDLRKYGINVSDKFYFYFVNGKKMYYGAFLLSISDKDKFMEFAKLITRDLEGKKIKVNENYKYTHKRDLHIVWNNNTAALYSGRLNPAYTASIEATVRDKYVKDHPASEVIAAEVEADESVEEAVAEVEIEQNIEVPEYIEEVEVDESTEEAVKEDSVPENGVNNQLSYYDIYDLKSAAIDSIENKWLKDSSLQFIKNRGTDSYANNNDFQRYIKAGPDAAFVLDYGLLSNMYTNPLLSLAPRSFRKAFPAYIVSLYKGMNMYATIDLKKDEVELNFDIKYSEKVNEVFAKIKKKKISKNFLKYMNKDLMGYYAVGMDIEGISEGVKDMLESTLPEIPEYGKTAVSAMDILDMLIDEKTIYKIFTGDAVMAVNRVKDFEVTHKTYDYDEEFNYTMVIDTSMQKMPEVLLMIGVGNKDDVNKIIDLLVNVKALKKEGNVYSIDFMRNELPVHLRVYDGILFISNNKAYVQNPVACSKNERLGNEHTKMFKKNTFVAFANTAGIARYFADTDGSYKDKKMLIETSNLFQHVRMHGYKKGSYMHSKYIIQLSESNDNSITDILKYMNILFLINDKRI